MLHQNMQGKEKDIKNLTSIIEYNKEQYMKEKNGLEFEFNEKINKFQKSYKTIESEIKNLFFLFSQKDKECKKLLQEKQEAEKKQSEYRSRISDKEISFLIIIKIFK